MRTDRVKNVHLIIHVGGLPEIEVRYDREKEEEYVRLIEQQTDRILMRGKYQYGTHIGNTGGGGGDQGRKFGLTTQMSPKGIGYGKIDRWWRCKALHEESFYLDVDSPVGHVFLTTHPINENIDDACRENIALHHWSASDFTRSVFIRDEVSPIGVARSANVSLHRDLGTTLALVLATAIRLSDLAQSGDPFR